MSALTYRIVIDDATPATAHMELADGIVELDASLAIRSVTALLRDALERRTAERRQEVREALTVLSGGAP